MLRASRDAGFLYRINTTGTSAPRQPLTMVIIIPVAQANSSTLLSQVTEGPDLDLLAPNPHLEMGSVDRRSELLRLDCNNMFTCLSSAVWGGSRIFLFPPLDQVLY